MGIPNPVIDVHDIRRQRRPDEHIPTAQPFETRLVPCRTLFTAEGELRDQLVQAGSLCSSSTAYPMSRSF